MQPPLLVLPLLLGTPAPQYKVQLLCGSHPFSEILSVCKSLTTEASERQVRVALPASQLNAG